RELFDRIGLSGRIPPVDGGDYLSVTNANANPNKIDAYLERTISARARFDPNTGRTDSTVTVALHNTAPAADLPGGVTAGNVGLPPGTNRTFLSLYSPFALRDVQLDGVRAGAEPQSENGRHRYGLFVDIPPGGTVKVQFDLRGTLRPSPQYRLTFLSQPVSNPDRLSLAVTGPSSATAQAGGAHGLRVTQQGDRAAVEAVLAGQTLHFSARFQS
ncbi:MAG: hypothetical protein JWM05_2413, partial [Acidimicrobiales bacterium]|nr:hypothetical protein [Acidimicrobiales bacterium]